MTPKRARDEWRGREPCFLAIDEMCPVLSLSENGRFTTCSVIFGNFWSFFWVSHLNRAKGVGPPGVGHGCLHPVRHVSNGAWASGSLTKLRKMGSEDGLVSFFLCKKKTSDEFFMARNQLQVLPEFALGLYSCLDALSLGASQVCGPDRGASFGPKKHLNAAPRFHGDLMEI